MADKIENKKQAYAKAKSIRTSGQKLNLVAKSIRGCNIKVAIDQLTFSKKRVSREVLKVLNSAIANAENNFQYDIDKLVVKEAFCGKQVVMKRFRARAKGRAAPIKKPYSNLTIILTEAKKIEEKHGTKS